MFHGQCCCAWELARIRLSPGHPSRARNCEHLRWWNDSMAAVAPSRVCPVRRSYAAAKAQVKAGCHQLRTTAATEKPSSPARAFTMTFLLA